MENTNPSTKQNEQLKNLASNTILLLDKLKVEKNPAELQRIALDLVRGPCLIIKDFQPTVWAQVKDRSLQSLLPENLDITLDDLDSVSFFLDFILNLLAE